MNADTLKKDLKKLENKDLARSYSKFFKTGKGEYGEGDIFLGIRVPVQRKVAKNFLNISLKDIENLLKSNIHEYRLIALIILTDKYKKADKKDKKQLYKFYLKNYRFVNNWDLVDLSAPQISGKYLLENKNERKILYEMAKSKNLWKRRIAVLSVFPLLKNNEFQELEKISILLLNDNHDLIHKAVGWMLRESGKINENFLINFLDKYYKKMPRTMLRYSIEKFPEDKRKYYLKK